MALAARIINSIVLVIVAVILTGIVLYLLGAQGNAVTGSIVAAAAFLVGPFKTLFEIGDNRVEVALNWGLAMLVYLAIGIFVTGLLERTADRRVGAGD